MERATTPHALHVLVCEQTRGDGHPSCGELWDAKAAVASLKAAMKEAGVAVRVTRTGCLGPCAQGPNVMLHPDAVWLRGCAAADLPAIAAEAIGRARVATGK